MSLNCGRKLEYLQKNPTFYLGEEEELHSLQDFRLFKSFSPTENVAPKVPETPHLYPPHPKNKKKNKQDLRHTLDVTLALHNILIHITSAIVTLAYSGCQC